MTNENRLMQSFLMFCLLCLLFAGNLACGQNANFERFSQNTAAVNLDDSQAIAAQTNQAIGQEITVVARVKKLLEEDTVGLPHQRFLIVLSNGTTILIAHDLKMAPPVPIKAGDILTIHGEYIWNKRGGLIHWTHHSNTPKHESGWIDFNGSRYQ